MELLELAKLNEIIAELRSLPEIDETLTGFDESEIRALVLDASSDFQEAPWEEELAKDTIEVRLIVPKSRWKGVKADLDGILRKHAVECHLM